MHDTLTPALRTDRTQIAPPLDESPLSIDDYIEIQAEAVSVQDLRRLTKMTGQLAEKLALEPAQAHAELHVHIPQLILWLKSSIVRDARNPLPSHLREFVVGANYLLKGADLIPDWIPEIGLTDDARILARIFERNPILSALAS